ncbi:hypothetical protein BJ878DRAFT_251063 [Calycina marina]|uniref:Uncharacterized protein n=1 Tax=Calycina marina TaxID=1763456 RepID=A0A9P8CBY1_9HELO|nr:hypothetical protein BJ878DRAFT_251063 [Calycina marina]
MASKRKLERLQDAPVFSAGSDTNGNVVMELVSPEIALSRVQGLDTQFLQTVLAGAYNTCPQTRQAIDLEYDRTRKATIAKAALTVGAKPVWTAYAAPFAPMLSPETSQRLSHTPEIPSDTPPEHIFQGVYKKSRTQKGAPAYSTPTAVAKRALRERRKQGLPVFCSNCKNLEPSNVKWEVPHGSEGLVCTACRKNGWKALQNDSERFNAQEQDHREKSDATVPVEWE